jgi:hypothetical protein
VEAWAIFAVLSAVYRWGRCPSFGAADSPRTVYKALFEPGLDPLARLGSLAARLPGDAPWGWINSLSGLLHAAAAALLYATLRRIGVKKVPALAAVLLLALSSRFWYFALVAGKSSAAAFGLALFVWGLFAWDEKDKVRRALAALLGLALALGYGWRAGSLAPAGLWLLAFGAGLGFQRLESASPAAARGLLAGLLILPLLRPYDLRRHNPTLEYAQAVIASAEPGSRVFVSGPTIEQAVKLVAPAGYDVVRVNSEETILAEGQDAVDRPYYFEVVLPGKGLPKGLLVPLLEPKGLGQDEIARRAEAVLAMPALSSVGLRDRAKYGFTGESILYDRYRAVLERYRERLNPSSPLRPKLDAQLAEYR